MANTSLDKSKIRILLLEGVHQSAVEKLNAAGYTNIELLSHSLAEEDLLEKNRRRPFCRHPLTHPAHRESLRPREKLVAVGCFCIGTNQVDLEAAKKRGVAVFNAPHSNTRSVAELVLAEAIMLLRGTPEKNAAAHRGVWKKSANNSYETRGKKLGIIGYGNIGTQLSVVAESLGMDVYFYDVISKLPIGNATQVGSMKELLAISDVVTLHVPETESTRNMFGAQELEQMKEGSILINASRGTVVDIEALTETLRSGKLLGAAIDVFPTEPKSNDEEFVSPLREFNNVILTPHVGGSTVEAQENIGFEVAEKLATYSDNGTSVGSVNFPEVALPSHPDQHRLLHIHQNIPGVMSEINQIFSENDINVCGQYLRTNDEIGYVVIDVDKAYSDVALRKLKEVKGTIRARVLF